MKITKAVIPAAGLGTRVLPASKAIPKEMLPIVDKPAIQYIVEEAVASGITDILIITNRGKDAMEEHFDYAHELEALMRRKGRDQLADELHAIAGLAHIYFIRQKDTKGLGHAVLQARSFVGNEPFAVLYGDDVIKSKTPVTAQLISAFERTGKATVGVKAVSLQDIHKYCSLKVEPTDTDGIMRVSDMVEKPTDEQIMSPYAILGRCLLTPEIFDCIERAGVGTGGEIQLTDAMALMARESGMTAVEFEGKRYDMGNKLGMMKAQVEFALQHKEIAEEFKDYLKEIVKEL